MDLYWYIQTESTEDLGRLRHSCAGDALSTSSLAKGGQQNSELSQSSKVIVHSSIPVSADISIHNTPDNVLHIQLDEYKSLLNIRLRSTLSAMDLAIESYSIAPEQYFQYPLEMKFRAFNRKFWNLYEVTASTEYLNRRIPNTG